jgi:hypothetical protein
MKIYQKYASNFSNYSKWLNHNTPEGCVNEMKKQQHGKVLVKFTEKLLSFKGVSHDANLKKLATVCVSTLKHASLSKELKTQVANIQKNFAKVFKQKEAPKKKDENQNHSKIIQDGFQKIVAELRKENSNFSKQLIALEALNGKVQQYKKAEKNKHQNVQLEKIEKKVTNMLLNIREGALVQKLEKSLKQLLQDVKPSLNLKVFRNDFEAIRVAGEDLIRYLIVNPSVCDGIDELYASLRKAKLMPDQLPFIISELDKGLENEEKRKKFAEEVRDKTRIESLVADLKESFAPVFVCLNKRQQKSKASLRV